MNVSVTGKIAAMPKHAKGVNSTKIATLKEGDEVAFDYSVISEMKFNENPELYQETLDVPGSLKRFENSKGKMISIFCYDGAISKRWGCSLYDKNSRTIIDGRDNINESEKDRWLAQFHFGGVQDFRFKNLLEIESKKSGTEIQTDDYWNVSMDNILAIKKGDDVVSVSNYVIATPLMVDATSSYNFQNGVMLPPMSVCFELTDRAEVASDYPELGLKKGDIASTEEMYICRYDLWGKKYFLINKNRILGTWHK